MRGPMRCRGCCVRKALCATICLVERVIAQTQARVFHSQNHFPEKLLSLFEPHSVVIRKGKPHKPNEFGRLVRIDEVEDGIVSGYEVSVGNRATSRRSSTMLPSLAGRRGSRRLIAVMERA